MRLCLKPAERLSFWFQLQLRDSRSFPVGDGVYMLGGETGGKNRKAKGAR